MIKRIKTELYSYIKCHTKLDLDLVQRYMMNCVVYMSLSFTVLTSVNALDLENNLYMIMLIMVDLCYQCKNSSYKGCGQTISLFISIKKLAVRRQCANNSEKQIVCISEMYALGGRLLRKCLQCV